MASLHVLQVVWWLGIDSSFLLHRFCCTDQTFPIPTCNSLEREDNYQYQEGRDGVYATISTCQKNITEKDSVKVLNILMFSATIYHHSEITWARIIVAIFNLSQISSACHTILTIWDYTYPFPGTFPSPTCPAALCPFTPLRKFNSSCRGTHFDEKL